LKREVYFASGLILLLLASFATFLEANTVFLPSQYLSRESLKEPESLWLHTSGTKILNEANQDVVFNGVSTMVLFGYEPPTFPSKQYTPSKMHELRSHGLNLIRLDVGFSSSVYGIPASQQTPASITFNQGFFPSLDLLINECAKVGLWVNICFTLNAQSPMSGWSGITTKGAGIGFPTWMYDGSWSYFDKTYYANESGLSDATRDFWNINDPTAANVRAAYQTWWKDVAYHYRNTPNVIFSLYNEPQCGGGFATESLWGVNGQPTEAQGAQMYKTFMESTIDVIRSQDNGNHVISASLAFLWYWDYNLKIDRPNVIVEGHSYSVVGTDFFNLGWRYNQPFMLSEFGGIEVGLSSRTTTITQIQTCNQNNIAWCYLRYDRVAPSTQTWTDLQNNLKPNLTYYH